MDYPPFYIVYICVLTFKFIPCSLYFFHHKNNEKISRIQPILRILLISIIIIWLLDSIPYLYLAMEQFSGTIIILSNQFVVIIAASAIFYQISISQSSQPRTVENIKHQPNRQSIKN